MGKNNPKFSYTIRVIAGAYVAYLGISTIRTAAREGGSLPFPVAAGIGVLLAVIGVIFVIWGLKGYKYIKDHPEEFEEQEEAEKQDQEEAPSAGILQKAAMPAHLQVQEDAEETADPETDSEETQE